MKRRNKGQKRQNPDVKAVDEAWVDSALVDDWRGQWADDDRGSRIFARASAGDGEDLWDGVPEPF